MRWQVHGSRRVYDSSWVCLRVDDVELPTGARIEHHVIEFPKTSVGAIVTDGLGRLLLLWRHRHITDSSGWECPAGWVEPGEDLAAAAVRETEEETGYLARTVEVIAEYNPLSGISTMFFTIFHLTDVTRTGEPEEDEAERVEWFSVPEVRKLLRNGLITDGTSLSVISYYLATLG